MKHSIKIHVIKVISLAAMLMVTGQVVCLKIGADNRGLKELVNKRKTDQNTPINMPNADFFNSDLKGYNLRFANLQGANLGNSDLSGANLTQANLTYAKFNGVTKFFNPIGKQGPIVTGANFANAQGLSSKIKDYLRKNGAINVPN